MMKKDFSFLIVILLGLILSAFVAWANRTHIAANFLAKELHVPVSIRSLNISKEGVSIFRLRIGNPPRSKTNTAFSAGTTEIEASFQQLTATPLIIDKIAMDNIHIAIEFYDQNGSDNNWSHLLAKNKSGTIHSKPYLIKSLILSNITVELIQANGSAKRYPPIQRIEFADISSESGFPKGELEKALFKMMMQDIFKRLNLEQLLQTISPFQYIPGAVPLPFFPGFF